MSSCSFAIKVFHKVFLLWFPELQICDDDECVIAERQVDWIQELWLFTKSNVCTLNLWFCDVCVSHMRNIWCNFTKTFGTYVRQARSCIVLSDSIIMSSSASLSKELDWTTPRWIITQGQKRGIKTTYRFIRNWNCCRNQTRDSLYSWRVCFLTNFECLSCKC